MNHLWTIMFIAAATAFVYAEDSTSVDVEQQLAAVFLEGLNEEKAAWDNKAALASWAYASNLTDENLKHQLDVDAAAARFEKEAYHRINKFRWTQFTDPLLKRQFYKYSLLGSAALPEEKFRRLNELVSEMEKIYSTTKLCAFSEPTKCDLSLEPELTDILAKSRDANELKHVWLEWRNAVGPKCQPMFEEYVKLSNEAARLNKFNDTADMWLESYEEPNLQEIVVALWKQVRPLYEQIHAYVRYELRKTYGDLVSEHGPIPAHLLGNMWAQTWSNIADVTLPYPDEADEDVTAELQAQGYDALRIFRTAEDFFKSINMTEMPDTFWRNSILEKPRDREIICHASAWDFYDGKDFRIKQCTDITQSHFTTAHHEMGHVEYYLQYKDQPIQFRRGANSGFHEAIGDVIALSVASPKHLHKLGLIKSSVDNHKTKINNLYRIGLSKIAFLPFGLLMDVWRWNVFSGDIQPDNYNCEWWRLRQEFQGVQPPVPRSNDDFDPAAKYHIIASVPYIRYFISFIIQFQFHKALCEKAGEYDPTNRENYLMDCDIYGSSEAGNALKRMLALGSSKPWPEAFVQLTGQKQMDGSSLMEYFRPLYDWLVKTNQENNAFVGWNTVSVCTNSTRSRDD